MRAGGRTMGYGVVTDLLPDVDVEQFDLERKKEKKAKLKAEQEAAGQQFSAVSETLRLLVMYICL